MRECNRTHIIGKVDMILTVRRKFCFPGTIFHLPPRFHCLGRHSSQFMHVLEEDSKNDLK